MPAQILFYYKKRSKGNNSSLFPKNQSKLLCRNYQFRDFFLQLIIVQMEIAAFIKHLKADFCIYLIRKGWD